MRFDPSGLEETSLFEVGKHYQFRLSEAGEEFTISGQVAAYDHPLLRLADSAPVTVQIVGLEMDGSQTHDPADDIHVAPYPGLIINVTSPNFISAQQTAD